MIRLDTSLIADPPQYWISFIPYCPYLSIITNVSTTIFKRRLAIRFPLIFVLSNEFFSNNQKRVLVTIPILLFETIFSRHHWDRLFDLLSTCSHLFFNLLSSIVTHKLLHYIWIKWTQENANNHLVNSL